MWILQRYSGWAFLWLDLTAIFVYYQNYSTHKQQSKDNIMSGFLAVFFGVFAAAVAFVLINVPLHSMKKDNSDGFKGRPTGLAITVDNETGVEYFISPLGGVTVRVGVDGKPLINEEWLEKVGEK